MCQNILENKSWHSKLFKAVIELQVEYLELLVQLHDFFRSFCQFPVGPVPYESKNYSGILSKEVFENFATNFIWLSQYDMLCVYVQTTKKIISQGCMPKT